MRAHNRRKLPSWGLVRPSQENYDRGVTFEARLPISRLGPLRGLVLVSCALGVACTPVAQAPLLFNAETVVEPANAISLADVNQIRVSVTLLNAGSGQVSAEFFAPGDVPYQGDFRALSGTPGIQTLQFSLPIAGTVAESGGMSGDWKVSLLLNGSPLTQQRFALSP